MSLTKNFLMKRSLFATIIAAAFLSGCLKNVDDDNESGCQYDPCEVKAPAAEIQSVKAYLDSSGINATQHCSGLYYAIDAPGAGDSVTACSAISVRYKGNLTNGAAFDSSTTSSQYFPLGNTIRGWINGVPLIRKGGTIRLYIPPTLGYGSTPRTDMNGNVVIPANSILIFEVKLDGVVL